MAGGIGAQQWLDHRYRGEDGQRALRLLVAPSLSPSRANTPDAVCFLERHFDDLPQTLLVVTSTIYVPYQFFAVAGMLLSGGISHLEFVGTPTSVSENRVLLAQRIAQEIHGALASAAQVLSP